MVWVRQCHHFVHLDTIARAYLALWDCFLVGCHGSDFIIPEWTAPIHVHSDVSGGFGCGAFSSDYWSFHLPWPWVEDDISVKELVPIVLMAATKDGVLGHSGCGGLRAPVGKADGFPLSITLMFTKCSSISFMVQCICQGCLTLLVQG